MSNIIWIKRLYIVLKSSWLKTLLKGKALSFASYEILSNVKKNVPQINTIIDVGANNGQFQKAAKYIYKNTVIHSFEPIPELFNKLSKNKNNQVFNYNEALGNEIGVLSFNQNKYNHSSSFYDIANENHNFPSSKTKKIEVKINTLDNKAVDLNIKSPSLLKLDVQGFEMEVLKGAINTIKSQIDFIIVETNFMKLYDNQPSFTELNNFLNQNDFELLTLLDFNLGKDKTYIESDFLYKKIRH